MKGEPVPFEEFEAKKAGTQPRVRLIAFNDIKLGKQRRYVVKGLIPRVGLTVVWGPPKSGKSFWTFDLVMHVALGWEYRGRRVSPGPVIYCAFEGQTGLEARVEAYRQRHLTEPVNDLPFYLQPATLDLIAEHHGLISVIQKRIGGTPPVVVVLDTLNRSLRGSESSDEDMGAYVKAADAIREEFNCAVIIVHHCGVEGTRPRGHTSLTGAVDAQLSVKRDAAGNIIVEIEWMKDGPEGEIICSKLEAFDVGLDEDGEPITSCVIVPVEGDGARSTQTKRLSGRQKLAMDCLTDLTIDGAPAKPEWGLPAGILTVLVSAWRTELQRRGILDPEAKNPSARWSELKTGLMAHHHIAERDGWVWKV
jgi:hypothetical protein